MPLPCLPPVLPLQDKEVAGYVPSVQNLLPPRTAQPPGLRRSGVGGGELRPWPAQRSGEGTRRRWGGGRSRPKGGEGGRRRTRVPGLVTAGGRGSPRPDSLGDGRRWGPAGHGHPPPAAAGGRSAPGGPWGQIPRLGGLDPGEGERLPLHDCTWAAGAPCRHPGPGDPTLAGWEAGRAAGVRSGSGARKGHPEESGLCVLVGVPHWPRGCFGDATGAE